SYIFLIAQDAKTESQLKITNSVLSIRNKSH
ncbi:MAG: hypothetical protein ACI8XG_002348, partial [Congregibacter sp.]